MVSVAETLTPFSLVPASEYASSRLSQPEGRSRTYVYRYVVPLNVHSKLDSSELNVGFSRGSWMPNALGWRLA